MPEYLPKWVLKRSLTLWKAFKEKEFSFEDAQKTLNEDSRIVAIILSELKKYGWIDSKSDPTDARKKIYYLKYHRLMEEMVKANIKIKVR
jgi:type I restriction enzyme M protein